MSCNHSDLTCGRWASRHELVNAQRCFSRTKWTTDSSQRRNNRKFCSKLWYPTGHGSVWRRVAKTQVYALPTLISHFNAAGAEPPTWLDARLVAGERTAQSRETWREWTSTGSAWARYLHPSYRAWIRGFIYLFIYLWEVGLMFCLAGGFLTRATMFVRLFSIPCPQDESFLPEQQRYQSYLALQRGCRVSRWDLFLLFFYYYCLGFSSSFKCGGVMVAATCVQ